MKKMIYALVVSLVVVSGLVFANRQLNSDPSKPNNAKLQATAQGKTELQKWEATPEGIKYKKWEESPEGKKVLAGAAKIRRHTTDSSNMEAVVTSLTLPPGSRLGFGVMIQIDAVDYIIKFEPAPDQLEQLKSLKVNDKIIIKSHAVSFAPKYAFPIVTGDYVERNGKVIFKRLPRKGGC